MEDRELVRRIQNGQKEYLNEIAEKYYNDIFYFCCYQTGSRENSYDLTQDTFLRFIRYVEHYQYQNLKGYLLTIAMNLCRSQLRAGPKAADPAETDPSLSCTQRPGSHTENSLLLADALRSLPDAQREAVLLHHFYGYKNREIAQMTGASYAAVKSRIKQGLSKLQRLLDKEDFYE